MSTDLEGAPDFIPSEIVNAYQVYLRRIQRRTEAFENLRTERAKPVEELLAKHRSALRRYEDQFDESLLKYRRDPNKMPIEERDPLEVKETRTLKRAVEDAERSAQEASRQLMGDLRGTSEFIEFRKATEEFEDWMGRVCTFMRCSANELDWKTFQIKRRSCLKAAIPTDLLVETQSLDAVGIR